MKAHKLNSVSVAVLSAALLITLSIGAWQSSAEVNQKTVASSCSLPCTLNPDRWFQAAAH